MLDKFKDLSLVGLLLVAFGAKAQISYCNFPPAKPLTGTECVLIQQGKPLATTTTAAIAALGGGGGGGGIAGTQVPSLNAVTSCQLVATANVASLANLPFIDNVNGIAGQSNSCILLQHQSSGADNGPWCFSSSGPGHVALGIRLAQLPWPVPGLTIEITSGQQYTGSKWYLYTNGVTIGTTPTTLVDSIAACLGGRLNVCTQYRPSCRRRC